MTSVRLKLDFILKFPQLPVDNKRIWVSFFKKALSQCGDGRFYDRYFKGTPNKDYTFSVVFPGPKFQGDVVELAENRMSVLCGKHVILFMLNLL